MIEYIVQRKKPMPLHNGRFGNRGVPWDREIRVARAQRREKRLGASMSYCQSKKDVRRPRCSLLVNEGVEEALECESPGIRLHRRREDEDGESWRRS